MKSTSFATFVVGQWMCIEKQPALQDRQVLLVELDN